MATQRVTFQSPVNLDLYACQAVKLCLVDSWDAKVVSGSAVIDAVVANSFRYLGGAGRFRSPVFNTRQSPIIQYEFEVDDTQFNIDGGTGNPYILTCADIVSVVDPCTYDKLDARIAALEAPGLVFTPEDGQDIVLSDEGSGEGDLQN